MPKNSLNSVTFVAPPYSPKSASFLRECTSEEAENGRETGARPFWIGKTRRKRDCERAGLAAELFGTTSRFHCDRCKLCVRFASIRIQRSVRRRSSWS